jgi:tetratricopeptide (TPR) repeat protein
MGSALGRQGSIDEALATEMRAIDLLAVHGNRRIEGVSRTYLADILLRAGKLEEAEAELHRAMELLDMAKPLEVLARATLVAVLLAEGRSAEALAEAHEAMTLLASLGKVEEGEALARVVYAEALSATGDRPAACAAISDARDRLLAIASRIEDPPRRDSFLHNVPENARTLQLAREWLGEEA